MTGTSGVPRTRPGGARRLAVYADRFMTGDWQSHSTWSDGADRAESMVRAAIEIGLPLYVLTDHVRRRADWIDDYVEEMDALKARYADEIVLLTGVEAKVMDTLGNIDMDPDVAGKVDVVLGSFHRVPTDDGFMESKSLGDHPDVVIPYWSRACRNMLANPLVDVWAHPTGLLRRHGVVVPDAMLVELATAASRHDKIVENNAKYGVPDDRFRKALVDAGVTMNRGSDAHSVAELRHWNLRG